jgi:hypothetical protein
MKTLTTPRRGQWQPNGPPPEGLYQERARFLALSRGCAAVTQPSNSVPRVSAYREALGPGTARLGGATDLDTGKVRVSTQSYWDHTAWKISAAWRSPSMALNSRRVVTLRSCESMVRSKRELLSLGTRPGSR